MNSIRIVFILCKITEIILIVETFRLLRLRRVEKLGRRLDADTWAFRNLDKSDNFGIVSDRYEYITYAFHAAIVIRPFITGFSRK